MKAMGMVLDFLRWIPRYFFPKTCYGCGKEGLYVCPDCRPKVDRVFDRSICPVCQKPSTIGATHETCRMLTGLDGLTSFYHYDGWAKLEMFDAKFSRPPLFAQIISLANEFGPLLESRLHKAGIFTQSPVVVPIPLHWWRERKRGYNQAALIAQVLATHLHHPMRLLVQRVRYTQPQTLIGHRTQERARRINVRGAFAIPQTPVPPSLVIVDDVWTTGATMAECCRVLKRAGAKQVWGVTLLRA